MEERTIFLNEKDLMDYEEETGQRVRDPVIKSSLDKVEITTENGIIIPKEQKEIEFTWANDVKKEPVKYLWFPYFIDSNTNTFGGETGTGKTWNLVAIMAAVAAERQPEGMPGIVEKHGNVLYLGGEDGNSAMRERLESLNANLSNIALVENSFDCMSGELEKLTESVRPVLIIFDPLLSYFPKDVNPNSYTGSRQVMDYLREFAREERISIICVVHPSKKEDYRLIHRFTGSGGFVDSVRTATYIGYHPTDKNKRVGIQPKNNITNTVPYVFELDSELGFSWCGSDDSITMKAMEKTMKLEAGKSGNLDYYIRVIEEVLKLHPEGLHMTAKDILKEYSKILEHDINTKSFGQALSNEAFQNALMRRDIILRAGSKTGNKQKYQVHYKESILADS